MIELKHIDKSFGGRPILKDVSISVEGHNAVCIIGPVACGKTTLLRCMAGLEDVDSGSISINGIDVTVSSSYCYDKIGVVFRPFNLFPHLNVLHNLTLALTKVLKMSDKDAENLSIKQLESLGLSQKRLTLPSELSSGQKQRVAIARCLVMNPDIILFDEPTSALDPIAASEVKDVLRKLKREKGIVIVTHDMELVDEIADTVVFMHEGRICEQGPKDEILNNPRFEETKKFLSYVKNLKYEIKSADFDRPELNAKIEHYCNRFGLGSQAFHYVQLVLEELLNIVPLENGCKVMVSKASNEIRLSIDLEIPFCELDCLDKVTAKDELSLNIIRGLCSVVKESSSENGEKLIHLELNKDRLIP